MHETCSSQILSENMSENKSGKKNQPGNDCELWHVLVRQATVSWLEVKDSISHVYNIRFKNHAECGIGRR